MSTKRGLQLDRVVLLGRTLEEYCGYFGLDLNLLQKTKVLDIASGVSSFSAEARQKGIDATAVDPIYELEPEEISERCAPDLEHVLQAVQGLKTYVWKNYKSPEHLRQFRERAYRSFLLDYRAQRGTHYIPGALPNLPFARSQFDLTLVSYFLFVYEDQFNYEFHRRSLLEIMRVTRAEARIYPTVTFEAEPSSYLERLKRDKCLSHFRFEIIQTDFEFLVNSNFYLSIRHRQEP